MAAGRLRKNLQTSKRVQKVQIVKPKRCRRKRGPKLGALLKPKNLVKLNYADVITLAPGAGAIVIHQFRAASIFDPDFTGTGHQPLLHDQYALLYGRYRVISAKIKVTPISDDATGQLPALYGVFLDVDGTFTYTDATELIEDKVRTHSWSMLGRAGQAGFANTNRIMTRSYSAKRMLGKDNAIATTAFGANPTAPASAFYTIWAGAINSNDPGTFQFVVELEQTLELTDPLVVAQS